MEPKDIDLIAGTIEVRDTKFFKSRRLPLSSGALAALWLGHADLDTTNHYTQARLETKRKALEQVDPKLRPAKPPRWKRDADLLAWLDSL